MGDEEIQVVTEWHGDILLNQIMEGADWGLAEWGMEAVALDKATTAVQTGALRNSKRTASPYYDGDDTQASKAGDLAEGGHAQGARPIGRGRSSRRARGSSRGLRHG